MAEYTANALQTVAAGENVLFTENTIPGCCAVRHRKDSGIVTLHNTSRCCDAWYKVTFSANIAISTGGTAGPISIAVAIGGEALPTSSAIVTPAAAGDFFTVFVVAPIDVLGDCCMISVKNISAQSIDIQNANLIIEDYY